MNPTDPANLPPERCFACDRVIRGVPHLVRVEGEPTVVSVGPECYRRVGESGYQPPKGGPRLVPLSDAELSRRILDAAGRGDHDAVAALRLEQCVRGMRGPGTPYWHGKARK